MGHCKDKQMKFEDYLSFFGNRHAHNITTNQLNQVLSPSFPPSLLRSIFSQLITFNEADIILAWIPEANKKKLSWTN